MASRKIVSFDWAIKNILRDKANFDILEGFLFALLNDKITITEICESESNQSHKDMKFNRVDVLAVNQSGEHIIIEVQYSPEQSYFKRLLYGTSKDIIDNMKSGNDYSLVKKVYSVSLIYFDVEAHDEDQSHSDYVFHGRVDFKGFHNGKQVKINPEFLIGYDDKSKSDINIFPEYFIIPVTLFNDEVKDNLDEWIYAFKNSEVKDDFKAPGIKEMGAKLDFISLPTESQKKYHKYLEDLASDRGTLNYSYNKGRSEGEALGEARGEARGKTHEKMEIAKRALDQKIPIETIAMMTGLAIEDVQKLQER